MEPINSNQNLDNQPTNLYPELPPIDKSTGIEKVDPESSESQGPNGKLNGREIKKAGRGFFKRHPRLKLAAKIAIAAILLAAVALAIVIACLIPIAFSALVITGLISFGKAMLASYGAGVAGMCIGA